MRQGPDVARLGQWLALRIVRRREAESKGRPFAHGACNTDLAAMCNNNFMHDRQAKAGSALMLCTGSPKELIEDSGKELRRNSFASVRDGKMHRALSRLRLSR